MDRRTVLKGLAGVGSLAATSGLSMPALSQGAAARTLKFRAAGQPRQFRSDLGDPVCRAQRLGDGLGHALRRRRQAAAAAADGGRPRRSPSDGLTWTFRLRPGLKFHDGEPVLAKDVVASLTRWYGARSHGPDDQGDPERADRRRRRTFKWALKAPYPKMLFALGKNSTPMAFIMPERIAKTDPFKQITEYIGSRPHEVRASEWVPGAKAVFEKFADYVPRAGAGILARRRQADAGRPHRMGHHARSRDGGGRAAERRGRLVGEPDPRPRAGAQEEPQHQGRHRRPARQHRLVPHEPPASALQRREGAARRADGAQPGRLHARAGRRRRQRCGSRCRASSRPARRSTRRRAARP